MQRQATDQAILALAAELGGIGLAADQALDAAVALITGPGVTSLADLSLVSKEEMGQVVVAAILGSVPAKKLTAAWEKVELKCPRRPTLLLS